MNTEFTQEREWDREPQAEHLGDSERRGVSPSLEAGGLQWKRVQGTCSFRKPGKGVLEGEPQADIGRWSTNRPRPCEPMPASARLGPGRQWRTSEVPASPGVGPQLLWFARGTGELGEREAL